MKNGNREWWLGEEYGEVNDAGVFMSHGKGWAFGDALIWAKRRTNVRKWYLILGGFAGFLVGLVQETRQRSSGADGE